MDQVPRAVQTGSADACDESEQRRFGQNGGLPHDTQMNGTLRTGDIGSTLPLVSIVETERSVLDSVHSWLVTVDHKRLGLMYIMYGLAFFVVAGLEASLMRIQLAMPNNHFLSPQVFNQLFTMHGTTMVFLVGMPLIFGFANYLVPLMIGPRYFAFPQITARSQAPTTELQSPYPTPRSSPIS